MQYRDPSRTFGATGVLGGLIAGAVGTIANLAYAALCTVAPGLSARARYERRHRRLAGPRPGARLG